MSSVNKASRSGFNLHCVVGPLSGRRWELKPGLLCIGRGKEGDKRYGWLLIPDVTVSREHANLRWEPEQSKFVYEHLSRTNPSRINGELTTGEVELGNWAQLGIGTSLFILERQKIRMIRPAPSEGGATARTSAAAKVVPKYSLKLLPNGYVQALSTERSNRIGVGAYLIWLPEKNSFALNTNPQAQVVLTTERGGEEVRFRVERPEEVRAGDMISVDLCQFLIEQCPDQEQVETFSQSTAPIGGMRKIQKIGQGSSSEVFLMQDPQGNQVAVKFLLPHLRHDSVSALRFEREARVAQGLNHPRLLQIISTGQTEDGVPFLVSEYLSGGTLRDLLEREGSLAPTAVGKLAGQIADGLHHLHQNGLVHRDVKPSNIFLRQSSAVVADFGTVRGVDLNTATETGFTPGTPHYMSPEQFRGFTEPRSDQYALGIVLYELVSGRRVFEAEEPIALAYMHVHQSPELHGHGKTLPVEMVKVLEKMLAKDPSERYPTVVEATRHLQQSLF